ncbi:hypothetical protein HPB47_013037 [Ixodes persulcatus]|uniref:Uncharacterized protein n=1 Tax=Ixodes persulcatus TaxID=34615 RepID=A0AC60NRV3_IXOPE|nr:hypothetical protein HPB47_013037 [Ixodes persulcatus]
MSSSETDDDIPDGKVCQQLCEEFASITQTDTACAQFYLQDRSWNLERSVNDFFEDRNNRGAVRVSGTDNRADVVLVVDGSRPTLAAAATAIFAEAATSSMSGAPPSVEQDPGTLKFITWNIDGIDDKNLLLRTKAVCSIIESSGIDVAFLQEVVPTSVKVMEKSLPGYKLLVGNTVEYFTATLLRKSRVKYESHEVYPFSNTAMGRNVTYVKLDDLGGLPHGFEDVWVSCGQRKEARYTWDMTRNDNVTWNGRFKPRCRFDRVYFKRSNPTSLKPVFFGLIGLERLKPHRCFPSDHWGIMSCFKVA